MQITRRNLMLGAALSSLAQESPFSVEVKLVTLLATVHEASGAPVTNLKKEDFRLEERHDLRSYRRLFEQLLQASA